MRRRHAAARPASRPFARGDALCNDAAIGASQLVPNVHTDADDGPSWLSPDGCRLYLSSDVAGTNDIYVATRGL